MTRDISDGLRSLAQLYPATQLTQVWQGAVPSMAEMASTHVDRTTFELAILRSHVPVGGTVADIGGGISLFAPGAATLGYKSILVDDFRDSWHGEAQAALEVIRSKGVEIVTCDVATEKLPFEEASLDAATSFECLEHLHSSPKAMLHDLVTALKPGGLLCIGVPNCVNLRKRITVPFGRGKWSQMAHWYEQQVFRGHVREPDVDDLRYIARDLGLVEVEILGRNWMGYRSKNSLLKAVMPAVDRMLRPFPGLCSNIYLLGRKPA